MNEETEEKIEKLANNLKNMHLASTIDEARQRAREIILSTAKEGEKSIKELMEETKAKLKKEEALPKAEIETKEKEEIEVKEEDTEEPEKADTEPEEAKKE